MRAVLYWQTARHLRPVQIAGRWWFNFHRPTPDVSDAPPLRQGAGAFIEPVARRQSQMGPSRFSLAGAECDLDLHGWDDAALPKLTRYNLHYFDDLTAGDARQREPWHRELIGKWIRDNPPVRGTGWEPFPTSLRIVNWIKWALARGYLEDEFQHSLAVQARWLARRLEHHLLGNHLFANAKALVFAGSYFGGAQAQDWHALGLRIVNRELREQILPDGGHFELSPMYHAAVLEDLLDLINVLRLCGTEPPQAWIAAAGRMREWLAAMTHPDGEIAFFNDAAFDVAANPAQIEEYAARLALPALALPQRLATQLAASGYVHARVGAADLLCDCAAVGPDHLPAHAHADTLAFELSIAGRRVLVNSGTSEYGIGPERQRQRGTAAHNTVVVNGQDSSEVWAGFRVARRARARMSVTVDDAEVIIDGSHDGYRRLSGQPTHLRRWRLTPDGLRIEDRIVGGFERAEAYFHFHPDIQIRTLERNSASIGPVGARDAQITFDTHGSMSVTRGTWHPRFGSVIGNQRIVVAFDRPSLTTQLTWGKRS